MSGTFRSTTGRNDPPRCDTLTVDGHAGRAYNEPMTQPSYPTSGRYIAGVFRDAGEFKAALADLLAKGFDRAVVSVLADRSTLRDHFDGAIPAAEELADRPDTPREDLDTGGAVDSAIRFLAEGLSILGVIGAAGAAYAVGGPVGVAAGAGAATEATLEGALSRTVDASYTERYERAVRGGGVVCWVHAYSAVEAHAAREILAEHGGDHVHELDAP